MTLKELITYLQCLLPGAEDAQVVVKCPVAHTDCWLHSEFIQAVQEPDVATFIRIEGGIGA